MGDSYGMLKLIVHTQTREMLGVHVFGTSATEFGPDAAESADEGEPSAQPAATASTS